MADVSGIEPELSGGQPEMLPLHYTSIIIVYGSVLVRLIKIVDFRNGFLFWRPKTHFNQVFFPCILFVQFVFSKRFSLLDYRVFVSKKGFGFIITTFQFLMDILNKYQICNGLFKV